MEVVFGGSFNPPTVAHYEIIKELSKKYDKVIVLPNGKSYGRKTLVDDKYRIDMLNLIIKEFDNVEVSGIEMEKKFEGTYLTLRELNHPVFVCGDDWIDNLETWICAKELVSENKFLVLTRDKTEEEIFKIIENSKLLKEYKSHFEVLKLNFKEYSSKRFRLYYDKTQVLDEVFEYINKHRLYKEDCMFSNNYLKIAISSPRVFLGRPMLNAEEAIKTASSCKDAAILCFPELSLTGYTIGDWIFNAELLNETRKALKYIVDNSDNQIIIVGLPYEVAGRLYNCAAVIQNKKVLGIIPKTNLPRTAEFYETRLFTSGIKFLKEPITINVFDQEVPFGGMVFVNEKHSVNFGVEICGDMWGQGNPHHLLYHNGADIVFNLSSSPYYLGKRHVRTTFVKDASQRYDGAYIYTSTGASETCSDLLLTAHHLIYNCGEKIVDEEYFDLNSIINKADIDLEAIRFTRYSNGYCKDPVEMKLITVDFELEETTNCMLEKLPDAYPFVPKTSQEFDEIISVVTTALKHRLDHIGINKVVLGISGGLDSTLALLFAYSTYKKYKMDPKNIIAITMPGFGTGSKSKSIAVSLMEKLGVDARNISIKKEAQTHLKMLNHDLEKKDVTYENTQARLRTMVLMNTANKEGGIVLGTGDMSEIALGWSTFNGDQMSMYNLNAGLPKTTIKALVNYFINVYPELKNELKKVCSAVISPELTGKDQSTEDTLGKYSVNDFLMYHLFVRGASRKRICFLLENVFNLEHVIANNYYDNFLRRFNRNQFKRLASPEGIKIFSLSLSPHGSFKYPGDMK